MATNGQRTQGWRAKFQVALRGVVLGVHGQSSFFVHFFMAAIVCVAAWILNVEPWQWCLLLVAISLVLTAEMFNSALEWLCRAITEEHDPRVGNALDIGSGAVLIASIGAALIGAIVFVPRLLAIIQ
ncbi:MAG: diacylglycerol kinase [Planctomycetales bacterium]|nr:diacylglycerol kinase [Planctomycetales bacterium]